MAFVNAGAQALFQSSSAFVAGNAVSARRGSARTAHAATSTRMLVEDGEFSSAKNTKWRENLFTGGIPGGEVFFRKWVEDGMKDKIPDLPEKLQASSQPRQKPEKDRGILGALDRMEFIKGFVNADNFTQPQATGPKSPVSSSYGSNLPGPGNVNPPAKSSAAVKEFRPSDSATFSIPTQATGSKPSASATARSGIKIGGKVVNSSQTSSASRGTPTTSKKPMDTSYPKFASTPVNPNYLEWARNPPPRFEGPVVVTPEMIAAAKEQEDREADPEAPDESLFAKYFPRETRNLAPEIKMSCENDLKKDFISVAMTPVEARATDIYFPKERAGKAPVIKIFYTGSLATASVSVSMEDIDPVPSITLPVPKGEATASLVEGPGGGLKLNFSVDGESVL